MLRKVFHTGTAAWVAAIAISLFCTNIVWGQSITAGDVTGTVTDPSGAAVPNAAITLTNVDTNASQTATTNGEGTYRFAFVPPGAYKIAVSASGFQTQERPTSLCQRGTARRAVNVQLAVASVLPDGGCRGSCLRHSD